MEQTDKSFAKFMLLWSGELISAIGSGITSFGLGVYVFNLTGKASAMALVTLLAFLPSFLLGVPAGVLADRYDRRLLMILGDSLSAIGLVFILICMLMGDIRLWQICTGVIISSVFSSLMDPAYRATVTDLLTEDQYAKASGLVQIASSSKYLISPLVAGLLLSVSDIKLLLIIDISTFFVTVSSTLVVRKGLTEKAAEEHKSFKEDFKTGWKAIRAKKGILTLVILTSLMTFFMGFIETLSTPMALAFTDSKKLGIIETICASGMLVTSILIGTLSIKKGYSLMLSLSLFGAGIFMILFGMRESVVLVCISGFLFFSMLPFANTSIDCLIRKNIDNSVQGRAWGLLGVISQIGYIAAYTLCGLLADYVFTPLLVDGGALSNTIGKIFGTGSGRGTGFLISIAGSMLCICALILVNIRSVKELDKNTVNNAERTDAPCLK